VKARDPAQTVLCSVLARAPMPSRTSKRAFGLGSLGLWLGLLPLLAAGQDKPPHLLLEPTEFTDVIDAFDGFSPERLAPILKALNGAGRG